MNMIQRTSLSTPKESGLVSIVPAMLGLLVVMMLVSPALAQDAKPAKQTSPSAPTVAPAPSPERTPDLIDVIVYSNTAKEAPEYLPTPDKPVYFFPMAGGLQRIGDRRDDNSEKVTADQVWKYVHRSLESQGYRCILPATKATKPPLLLIVFQWGTAVPKLVDDPGAVQAAVQLSGGEMDESELMLEDGFKRVVNSKEIGGLIGAATVSPMEPEYKNIIIPATLSDRYFVIVSAYDFALANSPAHTKKLVWQTRMSVPAHRTELAAVLEPLLHNGAAFFGRQTNIVKQVTWDNAKVNLGETKVLDYLPPANPSPNK